MRKHLELSDPKSCLNKAKHDELVFVLLERDPVAAELIWEWAKRRIAKGLNIAGDSQIQEALDIAIAMEKERSRPAEIAAECGAGMHRERYQF